MVTGVRWAESNRRKALHGVADVLTTDSDIIADAFQKNAAAKYNDRGSLILNDDNDESRRTVEQCYRTKKTIINPIVDWLEQDVWEFLNTVAKVPHCELYDGWKTRLGCLGCPMQNGVDMMRDLDAYPKYKAAYLRAFARMIENRKKDGNKSNGADWTTPQAVYEWWTRSGPKPMRDYYQMEVDDD